MNTLASQSKTLSDLFHKRLALSSQEESYRIKKQGTWTPTTWGEFGARVEALSAGMLDLGVTRGDTVAILAETTPQWCEIDMATIDIGAMNLGIYQTLLADQIAFILKDSGAKVLFVMGEDLFERVHTLLNTLPTLEAIVVWNHKPVPEEGVLELESLATRGSTRLQTEPSLVEDARAKVQPTDQALAVYTSGTTGQPKGVPLTHINILSSLRAGERLVEEVSAEDITLSFLPMAHVAEHVPGFFGRINLGLRTAYCDSYDTVLEDLKEIRPTYFGAVPRIFEKMYGRIHEEVAKANPRRQAIFFWAKALAQRRAQAEMSGIPLPLKSRIGWAIANKLIYQRIRAVFGGRVKAFVTGSAPIQLEILEFFFGMGMKIIEVYGLSEATAISFANRLDDIRLGTVGKAIPGVEYRVAEDGEILVKGPTVFEGYLNLPKENNQVFDSDGFLRTGDIGVIDAEGYLRITDRKKNLIKSAGGKYVAPARIEALVKEEPLVSQVYVHGDRKPYVVALLTLDEQEAIRVADELGCTASELPHHPSVQARMGAAVERANQRLARFEQIKKHVVLQEDFSIDEATLTPTMKLRRRTIEDKYAQQIEALYAAPRT